MRKNWCYNNDVILSKVVVLLFRNIKILHVVEQSQVRGVELSLAREKRWSRYCVLKFTKVYTTLIHGSYTNNLRNCKTSSGTGPSNVILDIESTLPVPAIRLIIGTVPGLFIKREKQRDYQN